MRICFVSRRYWPAVSGMSVYAENLLRELVALGHDVTLVQPVPRTTRPARACTAAARRPPTGCPTASRSSRWPGARRDRSVTRRLRGATSTSSSAPSLDLHAERPVRRAARPVRLPARAGRAAGLPPDAGVPNVVSHPGRRRALGRHLLQHPPRPRSRAVLDHAGAVLIGCASFRDEVVRRPRHRSGALHASCRARRTRRASRRSTGRWAPGRPAGAAVPRPGRPPQGRARPARGAARRRPAAGLRHRPGPRGGPSRGPTSAPRSSATCRRTRRRRCTARPTSSSAPPTARASATRSWRRWPAACRWCAPTASASSTACGTRRTACCTPPATSPACARSWPAARRRGAAHPAGDRPPSRRCAGCTRGRWWPAASTTVYAELRGTAPDLDWTLPATVDPTCRFRAAPHLL